MFSTPTRLGITLVCNSRTPVADLLANSPPSLPIVIYWGNPGTWYGRQREKRARRARRSGSRARDNASDVGELAALGVFANERVLPGAGNAPVVLLVRFWAGREYEAVEAVLSAEPPPPPIIRFETFAAEVDQYRRDSSVSRQLFDRGDFDGAG